MAPAVFSQLGVAPLTMSLLYGVGKTTRCCFARPNAHLTK